MPSTSTPKLGENQMSTTPQRRAVQTMKKHGDDLSPKRKKTHRNEIGPAELSFKTMIMKKLDLDEKQIAHCSGGFPDWVVRTNDGRLLDYYIKPDGTGKSSRLNFAQWKIATLFLMSPGFNAYLVPYTGSGEGIVFGQERKLSGKSPMDRVEDLYGANYAPFVKMIERRKAARDATVSRKS
jgi:hypothetical protein